MVYIDVKMNIPFLMKGFVTEARGKMLLNFETQVKQRFGLN
jgi:hypothetical protein